MKKNIKYMSLSVMLTISALAVLTLGSCNDFLSIEPQNEIVLENYWTEEADVNSVLNSCYAQLESPDCVKRMAVWGELRSDNMTNGSGTPYVIQQVLKENILETNSYTEWQCFYSVINRCNTVIYYAPDVNAKDPNFTDSELRATLAEATTLRALCYFYLIRTFRDVPYVTYPSNESKFDVVLDSLIQDVERVKDDAVRSYGEKSVENTCRITRWACYALLADLYLWKGDYQRCIDYCDLVIDHKIKEYEEDYEENPTTLTTELYGKYPLISESGANSNYAGNTYTEIFGTGNSFESIFELNFVRVNAQDRFYIKLAGITDPEMKRKIIGAEFISVFEEEARKIGQVDFLAQGTIYPDVVESGTGSGGAVIKSHHNVGGLPEHVDFKEIVEPLRMLFKDEVRQTGLELGLPARLVFRQPFPGPGLGVRIVGDITAEKVKIVQESDAIFREELEKGGIDTGKGQFFAALTNMRSVGVMGDGRTYDYAVVLRGVLTSDFMTAEAAEIPWNVLQICMNRIINEVKGVNRVLYDLTSKPPGTIELE